MATVRRTFGWIRNLVEATNSSQRCAVDLLKSFLEDTLPKHVVETASEWAFYLLGATTFSS
jgi:hypothetical protein